MKPSFVLGLSLFIPVVPAQDPAERTAFEKLLPGRPLVEISLRNPARLWADLVKSRLGRLLAAESMAELRSAWDTSFELGQIQSTLTMLMGLDKKSTMSLFRILQQVSGGMRLAYYPPMPPNGLGGWILELDGEAEVLTRASAVLLAGMGSDPIVEEARITLLGQQLECCKQRAGTWRFVRPFTVDGRLYALAWQDPEGAGILTGAPRPDEPGAARPIVRSLLADQRMDLAVAVDLHDVMKLLQQQYESADIRHDSELQFAKLVGVHDLHTLRLGLDVKRGRIVHELRAEVTEGGRFAAFLGSILPREGRAVGLLEFQPEGVRTSAMISVNMPKAYAEFTRLFKEGAKEFGGEEYDLEEVGQQFLGFSIKKDLIGPLDGRILFFEGEKQIEKRKKKTGFCLGVGTRDSSKTGEVAIKLFEKSTMAKKEETDYKGFKILAYDFSFLWSKTTVRYAMTDRFFLFAFGEAGHDYLRRVIDSEKLGEEERFRPTGDLKAQLALVPQESATLVWANTVAAAGSLLEAWGSELARVTKDPEAADEDPSAKVLKSLSENLGPLLEKEGLATTLSAMGRDRHGFWIRWIW